MYRVLETSAAQKALRKMQPQWADRIRGKIAEIATSPYDTHNNVTKLQGRNGYRLRVGDWRVLYELHDGELVLLMVDVLPRGSAYRACGGYLMDRNFERLTKGGQTFVLVPEEVYENLQEDAEMLADIQAYDAAKSRNEEIFPAELGVKLSEAARAGKSLVPVWREYREMTQTALAEASGVNRVYLSEIESGKKPGSVEALKRIAEALRIALDDLV